MFNSSKRKAHRAAQTVCDMKFYLTATTVLENQNSKFIRNKVPAIWIPVASYTCLMLLSSEGTAYKKGNKMFYSSESCKLNTCTLYH